MLVKKDFGHVCISQYPMIVSSQSSNNSSSTFHFANYTAFKNFFASLPGLMTKPNSVLLNGDGIILSVPLTSPVNSLMDYILESSVEKPVLEASESFQGN